MLLKNIPVLRIFDVTKAKEFYIDWLGFEIGFEHQFEAHMPYYIGICKDGIELHLSEHHGDATPGSKVFITCNEIEKFHAELLSKPYKYYRPTVEKTFYGSLCIDMHDPFGNKLSFNEYITP
ncbi:glyoxalase superfamily protein [Ferruginibacter sp. SUN106]|uniref:glyoxalase superfamily protein n=1 Tax=Ferruginibacter sp. SUN106 TaxID=2978348 RepID=UPI003D359D7F